MSVVLALLGKGLSKHAGLILAVVSVIIFVSAIYLIGRYDGAADTEREARDAVFDQLKERNITNEKVDKMSDAELCRAIGGELRDGRCL